jgi:hypothetical protein
VVLLVLARSLPAQAVSRWVAAARTLTAADRCDRCSARALVEIALLQGGSLLWCGYHFGFIEDRATALREAGDVVLAGGLLIGLVLDCALRRLEYLRNPAADPASIQTAPAAGPDEDENE